MLHILTSQALLYSGKWQDEGVEERQGVGVYLAKILRPLELPKEKTATSFWACLLINVRASFAVHAPFPS